ncbi:SMI1/KNR4 family protein [Deinococcus sonorensis]|uniref:SMI1/KNR4 family protein n=2 Tax=Deinococcus sonorensis TaxID=309891 RepID=A0AAU7UEI4_9DEIO
MSVPETLAQLEQWLKTHYRAAHGSLQPGLSDAEIDELLSDWPHRLSDDVRALYRWHDGFEDTQVELLPGLSFLPLAQALELARMLWAASAAQAQKGGPDFFPKQLLPILSDEANDVLLLVQGDEAPLPSSPAQVVALQRGQRLYAFERLDDLLRASLALLQRGVYQIDQDRDRVELADARAAQTEWRKYRLLYLEQAEAAAIEDADEDLTEDDTDLPEEVQAEQLMSNLMSMLGLHPDDLDPSTATLDELNDLAEMVPPEAWPEALQERYQALGGRPPGAPDPAPNALPPSEDTP